MARALLPSSVVRPALAHPAQLSTAASSVAGARRRLSSPSILPSLPSPRSSGMAQPNKKYTLKKKKKKAMAPYADPKQVDEGGLVVVVVVVAPGKKEEVAAVAHGTTRISIVREIDATYAHTPPGYY